MTTKVENRADERRTLKQYLTRYYKAKKRLEALRTREARLRREIQRQGTGDTSEIEARIQRQAERSARIVAETLDIIDLLPEDSLERTILEYRHLDCMPWETIQKTVHITRTPCYNHYIKGLDLLLEAPETRATLARCKAFSGGKNTDFTKPGG